MSLLNDTICPHGVAKPNRCFKCDLSAAPPMARARWHATNDSLQGVNFLDSDGQFVSTQKSKTFEDVVQVELIFATETILLSKAEFVALGDVEFNLAAGDSDES